MAQVENVNDSNVKQNDQANEEFETAKETSNDFVSKVLKEKKNAMAKNFELQQQLEQTNIRLKEMEEQQLLNQQNFQKLAEQRKLEVEDWKTKYTQQQRLIEDSVKLGSFKQELNKLGVNPERMDYITKMVDLKALQYDNSTQVVLGADDLAREVATNLPEFFGGIKKGVNHQAPVSSNGQLTLEEWKKLSPEDKVKRKEELYRNMGFARKP